MSSINGLSPLDSSFQHALCEEDRARVDALIAALGRGTIAEQDAARWERFYLASFRRSMGGDPTHSAMRADLMMAEWRKRFAPTLPPCHHCGEPSDPSTRGVRNALRRNADGIIEVEYWVCNACGASTSRDVKP